MMSAKVNELIYFLLLIGLSGIYTESCPDTCQCSFDSKVSGNSAKCQADNTTLYVNWLNLDERDYGPQMVVTCEFQGYGDTINCTEIPHFNIAAHSLKVSSCPTNLLACISAIKTHPQPAETIKLLETDNLKCGYTYQDFQDFKTIKIMIINLTDTNTFIPIATFNALSGVHELHINGGNFELERDIFNYSSLIDKIYFRNNNISFLDVLSLKGLRCSLLHIEGSNFENIGTEWIIDVIDLTELHIVKTKLKHIENGAFISNFLEHLLLQENRIELLPNELLKEIPKLQTFQILDNEVDVVLDTHVFTALSPSVTMIELRGSKLYNLTDTLFSKSNRLKTLKMHKTEIEELPEKVFWDLTSLTTLILSDNNVKYLPEKIFNNLYNLEYLDFNSNQLTALNFNQFSPMTNLKVILLDYNKLSTINVTSFMGTHLQNLSLVGNGLIAINGDTTLAWKALRTLDLFANKLTSFEDLIYGLPNLTMVNLTKNQILSIRENKTYFMSTKAILDLRQNNISNVINDQSLLNHNLARGKITIYLSNTIINCNCLLTKVLHEWNEAGFLGSFENNNYSDSENITKIDTSIVCKKPKIVLMAISGFSIIGVIIILIILIPIVRYWRLIWMYLLEVLRGRSTHRSNHSTPNEKDNNMDNIDEVYDVYISYAQADESFVEVQLKPKIELEYGVKVLVNNNNTNRIAEESISNRINYIIESVTCFIIILTENYLISEELCLEFKMANEKRQQESLPKILLIVLDESVTIDERMSIDLKLFISVNTYLVWKDPKFWERLKVILPKSKSTS